MSQPPNTPSREPYYTAENLEPMRSLGFLIKRCGSLMSLLAESRFESQSISFTQFIVLMRLRFQTHMSATQLSCEIGHDMGAMTRVVDSLERSGFVRRERSQHDRRAVEIALTAEGRRQVEGSVHILVGALNELIEPFSNGEIDTLISLLQRILARLQENAEIEPALPVAKAAVRGAARRQPPRKAAASKTTAAGSKTAGGKS